MGRKKLDPGWKSRASESLVKLLWVKLNMLKFFVADPDPGFFRVSILDPGSGVEKFGSKSRDKHPGSATLIRAMFFGTFAMDFLLKN
jgi:hypothetical protein